MALQQSLARGHGGGHATRLLAIKLGTQDAGIRNEPSDGDVQGVSSTRVVASVLGGYVIDERAGNQPLVHMTDTPYNPQRQHLQHADRVGAAR